MFRRNPAGARPIGQISPSDGWKSLPIKECGEPLVPLGSFSNYPQIATDSIYVGERISSPYPTAKLVGALFTVFVREGVARRLSQAAAKLPPRHMLLVWDAYRSLAVQKALFDYFVEVLVSRGAPHEQAIVDAQKFVSIPSNDPTRPPPHNTGGAVDLTIIRFSLSDWRQMEELTRVVQMTETSENWRKIYAAEMERLKLIREATTPLEMGTVFDDVHPETATRFYEELDQTALTGKQRENRDGRRLLYDVMTRVGFSNYREEWWHFDFGNQFDMARTGRQAIYGAATLSEENDVHEKLRNGHYSGCIRISNGHAPQGKIPLDPYPFVRDIAMRTGNLRDTVHPSAAAI